MALQWTFLPFIVETDCLEVFNLIQSKEKVLSELAFVVKEVQVLMIGNRRLKSGRCLVIRIVLVISLLTREDVRP